MARTVIQLHVLVSSPSDLKEERGILEDVVRELNAIWQKSVGIELILLRWETDTRPAFGLEPQKIVNDQLGREYDIFVGLMWARFGTPTQNAGSGTEEEFIAAAERFDRDPNSLSVMFYFKTAAVPPHDIDPDQLKRVQAFRQKLTKVALIRDFESPEEFASLMRIHLSREIEVWKQRFEAKTTTVLQSVQVTESAAQIDMSETVESEEDLGFLDLMESSSSDMEVLTEALERMNSAMTDVAEKTARRHDEIETANSEARAKNRPPELRTYKRIFANAADDLNDFVSRIETELPIYSERFARALRSVSKALAIHSDFENSDKQEVVNLKQTIQASSQNLTTAIESYRGLRDTIAAFPRVSTVYNKARRNAVRIIDQLIEESIKSLRISEELLSVLEDLDKRA